MPTYLYSLVSVITSYRYWLTRLLIDHDWLGRPRVSHTVCQVDISVEAVLFEMEGGQDKTYELDDLLLSQIPLDFGGHDKTYELDDLLTNSIGLWWTWLAIRYV